MFMATLTTSLQQQLPKVKQHTKYVVIMHVTKLYCHEHKM